MNNIACILPALQHRIESLKTLTGENISFINPVVQKKNILLSSSEVHKETIIKNNPIPIKNYLEEVFLLKAEESIDSIESNVFESMFQNFKKTVMAELNSIEKNISILSCLFDDRKISTFIEHFSNGVFMKDENFQVALENVISFLAKDNNFKTKRVKHINTLLNLHLKYLKNLENEIKKEIDSLQFDFPREVNTIDQVEITSGNKIPFINGIDVHPKKFVYAAATSGDGTIAVQDLLNNNQIYKISVDYNIGAFDNLLWSPSGQQLLVSTHNPPCIILYDEKVGFIKKIENTYWSSSWGAIWINENMVAVGYEDGVIKIFNIVECKEIVSLKISGQHVWGISTADESCILAGDYTGHLTKINWTEQKVLWSKQVHQNYHHFRVVRVSETGKAKIFTGSSDCFVKCIDSNNQNLIWEIKMNDVIQGISLCSEGSCVLAMSYKNQLYVLDSQYGNKLLEFNKLTNRSCSLRYDMRTDQILVGTDKGKVIRLKLIY